MLKYGTPKDRIAGELTEMVRSEIMKMPLGIYGITSNSFGTSNVESAELMLRGGVKVIQYREKHADLETRIGEAKEIRKLTLKHGAVFIVNDRLDVAIAADADGVHLGQSDMSLEVAKKTSGDWMKERIVGISVTNVEQAIEAQRGGASYLGAGPVFATSTKTDEEPIGVDALRRIRASVEIPIFAIGGIKLEHIKQMKEEGMDGVAIISGILGARDPLSEAKELIRAWDE